MAMFVHLAPESSASLIKKNGIRRRRRIVDLPRGGVYAMPVARNYYASHQWLRELRRRSRESIVGVYFRINDDEQVFVGHYNQTHRWMAATQAIAQFSAAKDQMGWQVIIPRSISASEIHRIRNLPQVLGWRFFPNAKGKPPRCTCDFCIRGDYGAQRLRKQFGGERD